MAKKDDEKQRYSSNVKVVVRCRPTNSQEKEGGFKTVVRVIDDHMLVFDPKTDSEAMRFGRAPPKRRERNTILDRRAKDLRFAFDRVFNEHATNQELFENTTYSVVDSLLEGYNCSVFAYGATSAGKTHTMLGSPKKPGVIFLTMMELYKKIDERTEEFTCEVSVSYLEIYNETARDLLQPTSKPLAVREDPKQGVCVTGLSLHKPINAEELLSMLESGNLNRTQHPTDANKQSSRSHAVFQVFVRQRPKGSGLSTDVKVAKMSLIDLAGSERATVTTNRGARFREGANINRSLLALGNCINALAENKPTKGKKEIHIPYRDSKLTRLLKDSLGGNCKTIMIAAVSPSSMCYEDTYNTLKYANRAKNIKSNLKSNVISVDFHVSKYAKIVEELKQQVEDLKSKVKRYENGDATPMKQQQLRCTQKDQLKVIQDELCGVYKDRCLIRRQIIDCEAAEKELKIKLFKRERNLERIQIMLGDIDPTIDQTVQKLDRFRSATQSKQNQLNAKVQSLVKQLADNSEKISVVKTFADDWMSSVVEESLRESYNVFHEARVLDVEKVSARAQAKQLRRYVMLQEKDSHSTERLLSKLLSLVSKQQLKLKETDSLSLQLEQEYTSVMNDLEGSRRITWADESTRESLDVSSILNFSSCTPVRTPARSRCVLQANTPQMASKGANIDIDEDYSSITALNSVYNSKISRVVEDLTNEVSAGIVSASAGSPMPSVPTHPSPGKQELVVVTIPTNKAFVNDIKTKLHLLQQKVTESTQMQTDDKLNHTIENGLKQSTIVAGNVENDVNPLSLSRRRTRTLDDDFEVRNKVPRFDPESLFHVPKHEPTDLVVAANQNQGCTPAKVFYSGASSLQNADRERRGTMVIQKGPDEVKHLPVIKENECVAKDMKVVAVNQEEAKFPDNTEAVLSQHDNRTEESCVNDEIECEHSSDVPTVNTTKSTTAQNDLNATFDVLPASQDVLGEEAGLDVTYTCTQSNNAKANLSGIEPIEDSPTRQPQSVLCQNNRKENDVTPKTASLHEHGLPSMRDGSSLKISKAVTPLGCRNGAENVKIELKDHKTLFLASKASASASATKSRYASIAPRLYQENPRYANSGSKARSRTDKRRRSNTLSNPIRLRDSRRRSRSSTAATPYNLQAARKNVPSHVVGIRKAIEQMGVLKAPKSARNFTPASASGVVNSMPSSAL